MSVTFGFYNSLNHDRTYDAIQMSSIFDGIIKDGIFESIGDQLEVSANSGMVITVGTGRAWFDHTWTLNDSLLPLTVPDAEVVLDRIDSVILEVNADVMTRANSIYILSGTPSSSPVHPDLINTEDVHQYRLADIAVGAGVTDITQAEITNYIGTTDTPFITGILETMNVDMLVAQWQSEYQQMKNADHIQYQSSLNADHTAYETQRQADDALFNAWFQNKMNEVIAWYNNLQVTIDQNVAVRLQNEIGTLSLLQTETKNNLVEAINELVGTSYPCFIRVTCAEEFAGNTVTLSYGGSVVKSAVIPITAPYVVEFAVKETGQYTIRETVYDISTTVNVTNYTIYNAGLFLGSIALTVDADFIGSVITCTDGSTTKTWLCDGLTHVFSVGLGTWTISGTVDGKTYETSVTVTEYREYSAELHTISAFNYIEWLESAGIDPSGYSSLDDVLADEAALRVLFTLHASVDYLSDSATGAALDDIETIINNDYCAKWINAKDYALDTLYANESIAALMDTADKYFYGEWAEKEESAVPVLASKYGSNGEAIWTSGNTDAIDGWHAFDNSFSYSSASNSGNAWYPGYNTGVDYYVGYKFNEPTVITKLAFVATLGTSGASKGLQTYKVRASNDGTTWVDLTGVLTSTGATEIQTVELNNSTAYTHYVLWTLTYSNHTLGIAELWLYTKVWGPVGAVPKMTSNTTPYGVAFADSEYQDNVSQAYNVFRGITDGSVRWGSSIRGATLGDRYIGYKFINPVCVRRVKIQNYSTVYDAITSFKVQASNDGTTWTDVTDEITKTKTGALETEYVDFNNDIYYLNWRVFVLSATGGSGNTISVSSLQFYGRELKGFVPKLTADDGKAFADGVGGGSGGVYCAFDNNISTFWCASSAGGSHYLGYNFGVSTDIMYAVVTNRMSDASTIGLPWGQTFKLQGSNDNVTWNDISDQCRLVHSNGAAPESLAIEPSDNTPYTSYRIYITSIDNGSGGGTAMWCSFGELQFYGLDYSESIEYDIYSAAADTVFYYPGGDTSGSPVVLCTTDNTGHGKAIISLAEGTSITLYSTVAKDTETGTNNYSKNISLSNSNALYLMPDGVVLYWYGYTNDNVQPVTSGNNWVSTEGHNIPSSDNNNYLTNKITHQPVRLPNDTTSYCAIGTKEPIDFTRFTKLRYIWEKINLSNNAYGGISYDTSKKAGTNNTTLTDSTNSNFTKDITNVTSPMYVCVGSHNNTNRKTATIALWLE